MFKKYFLRHIKNFEIIFWDNLSTDKSQIELKKFKDKESDILNQKIFKTL